MKHLLLTIMAFLVSVSLAQAQELFIGLDYGVTEYNPDSFATTGDFDSKDSGYVFTVGSRTEDGFGVEVNYADFGVFNLDLDNGDTITGDGESLTAPIDITLSGKATGLGVAVSYKLDGGEGVAILPRLGYHQWDVDYDASSSAGSVELSESGTDLFYGIGVELAFTESVAGAAGFTRYTFGDGDLDLISVGVRFNLD